MGKDITQQAVLQGGGDRVCLLPYFCEMRKEKKKSAGASERRVLGLESVRCEV
jgi:hypothetical protein